MDHFEGLRFEVSAAVGVVVLVVVVGLLIEVVDAAVHGAEGRRYR